MIKYGFKKILDLNVKDAEEKVNEALAAEGFGILTRIDVKKKFKEKLDVDFTDYIILGACNPPHAYKSILEEEDIGLMLPCNVIIYKKHDKTVVSIIKPSMAMGMIDNPNLFQEAETVEQKLKRVFESL